MSAPIIEGNFTYGVNVVDIGDLRVARGMSRREYSRCKHLRLAYDPKERRVQCRDCETDVEPFDAFTSLVERFDAIDKRIELLRDIEKHTVRSRAAKRMDEAWRSRRVAPCCPHCHAAILPEDVAGGISLTNKELVIRRREALAAKGGQ